MPLFRFLHTWLCTNEAVDSADLIFALAGRVDRKIYGLRLLHEGWAPRLLLSVGRFEIRRFPNLPLPVPLDLFKLAGPIPPPQRHFFVCFGGQQVEATRIRVGHFGTWNEILALAQWIENRSNIQSVLIVSSGAHLRRIRVCCRALLPPGLRYRLVSVPDDPSALSGVHGKTHESRPAFLASELGKLVLYRILSTLYAGGRAATRASEP